MPRLAVRTIWVWQFARMCRRRDELRQNANGPADAAAIAICYRAMEPAPHILVVDDDREIRDLLARFLVEKHQMRVTAVRDAREARRAFALVYPQKDRKLTPPDVQKIAEAFLLWHGNHDWKVVNVAPTTDGPIGFALATQDGSVIARFTMDPHTAEVERIS